MNTVNSTSYISHLMSSNENPNHAVHILETSELCRRIAIEQINEIVPQMVEEVCLRIIKEYLNGNLSNSLNYDIHSIASVSIADYNKMFKSESFSKFISAAVTDEIRKRISEIDFNIRL